MAKSRAGALRTYVLRRLLLMIPTLLGITFIVFVLCQFVPGGPIDQVRLQMAGAGGGGEVAGAGGSDIARTAIPPKQLEILRQYYGFDKPILVRYGLYLKNLATLNLGESQRYLVPVWDLIVQRMPISLYYGLITTLLTYLVCIPLGIAKALRHRSLFDNLTSAVIFIGYAIPGYALGAVLLVLLSVKYPIFPLSGFVGQNFDELSTLGKLKDLSAHTVLPLIALSIGSFAFMTMLMKNGLMENMGADYVKTALAKGMSWQRAVFVHALRNSLIPLATSFGNIISLLVVGFLLIERVFGIHGMGLLFFDAMVARDYPLVMGVTVISSVLLLVGNLLSDLAVAFVDPRVRFG
ncbi:MAG: ABC transporter permease subunit [Candidatus Eisenbacteria bacterium]|uniref:ABC transporter permease subunit n=1 Tax=Eiseniibacteriota bacterium TaxID=2212470 RepID=A0A956SCF2_UNCEI|nr:ABC transporter permease subunit [Candidatus Eisenbacteria bacterium]MCB9465588.1 ABC transporter permease subunit [Candidatus Eisenbacteria bacterium]